MIDVETCKKLLGNIDKTNDEIEAIRDGLYVLVESIVDAYINSSDKIQEK